MPSSSWPISSEVVEPYYREVEQILGVDDLPFEASALYAALHLPVPLTVTSSPDLGIRFSKWAAFSRRNLAQTAGREVLQHHRITTFIHCNVTELLLAPDAQHVSAVLARNYAGTIFRFEAQHFVLATGTIETSRLLLASRSVLPAGLGNRHDQVGRRFHDHISAPVATLTGVARRQLLADFAPFLFPGTTHSVKMEASAALRQRLQIPAVMAHIVIEEPEDSGPGIVRALLTALQRHNLRTALTRSLPRIPAATLDILRLVAAARLRHRRAVTSRALVQLRIDSEQLPRRENRIRLHPSETDILGLPRTVIDWTISPAETAGIHSFARYLRKHLARAGVASLDWVPEALDPAADLPNLADTYHPMGGTLMGADPSNSVVNTSLGMHEHPNLSIASAATFPAGGSSNPTFALMALSLRLADHLAAKLAG